MIRVCSILSRCLPSLCCHVCPCLLPACSLPHLRSPCFLGGLFHPLAWGCGEGRGRCPRPQICWLCPSWRLVTLRPSLLSASFRCGDRS